MHAVWSPRVNEALAEHGLDFLTSYVWGRTSALGEPSPRVAAAAFAWFEPTFIAAQYAEGRRLVSRETLLAVRTENAIAGLAEILDGENVSPVVDVLRRGLGAADAAGRPMFAGLCDQPWPAEPVGQLWRACDLLREYRGDSHIAAAVSAGVTPVQMNVLTELWIGMPLLSYTATRGWSEHQMEEALAGLTGRGWLAGDELTEAGRRARHEIEDRTDAAEQSVVAALGSGLDEAAAALNHWGQRCIDAGAFPPDPLKRAAG
jgi:hypothetical protein